MNTDLTSEIPYQKVPDQKPKSGFLLGAAISIAIILAFLIFLKYAISVYFPEMSLDENIRLQLWYGFGFRSDHLIEGILSTKVSLEFKEEKLVSREPIDFAFVIDFPGARDQIYAEVIQNASAKALPFLGDQDRLSTLIFDGDSSDEPIYNFVSLANTTEKNKNTIFSNPGEEFSANKSSATYKGLQTAIKLLNQRENMNSVTGILLYTMKCNRKQMEEILQGLKSPNGGLIPHAFLFCSQPSPNPYYDNGILFASGHYKLEEAFVKSLTELQHSVFGDVEFFVKPLQSIFFQGVELVKTEFIEESTWGDKYGDKQMFIGRNLTLFPSRQNSFDFEIKIPNVTQPLPKIPAEVKLANCEMVFTHINGSQFIRNKDWTMDIW